MWHILVSTADDSLAESLRAAAPEDAVILHVADVDETVETLARSSRVDAVVTDDPEVERAVRDEFFGNLPVMVVEKKTRPAGEAAMYSAATWEQVLSLLSPGPGSQRD